MLIRNINPLGEVEVPLLRRIVAAGEVIDVPDEVGAALLDQPMNWIAADPTTDAPDAPASTEE